nr:bifunctional UDP-sugar hydrolase/5'-nucleotidase [uncultured Bacillus sp.]
MEVIHIYHTNDLHSHFEHWPRIHHFLQERKKWHEQAGEGFLLFDLGDHADRSHPLTEATHGNVNVDLLNKAGYHAVTIGNNEGITFPHEDLEHLYDHRLFEVLLANLYREDGERPGWAKAATVYETKGGIKATVTGLTASYSHLYRLMGWKVTDPYEELRNQLDQQKEQSDMIILLSHLGIHDDEKIACQFPEVDVIIGGHTHHIFHEGKMVNNTLLACAGKYGMYIGHIRLAIDPETKKIKEKRAWLYDTNELPPVNNEIEQVENFYNTGKAMLSTDIIASHYVHTSQDELAVLLCNALRESCAADCAFINKGLILENLDPGIVTKFDLHKICPHPINPCVVELTGSELKEVLVQTLDEKWSDMQIMGFGFRGKIMGKMIYSGIQIARKKQYYMFSIHGIPIVSDSKYTLAIPDMFTFGKFFPAIFRAENKQYMLPDFMRHLLAWKIQETEKQAAD